MRDVFWRGTCDEGVEKLGRMLGWELELKALVEKGRGVGGEGSDAGKGEEMGEPETQPKATSDV